MVDRLVGSKTIQRLRNHTLPAGLRDVQEWTGVSVQFRRRDSSGWSDVGAAVDVISIRLNDGHGTEALGGVETTTKGTVKVFLADVADAMPQPKDRFDWKGHTCVVELVEPDRVDLYVAIEFTLLEGN